LQYAVVEDLSFIDGFADWNRRLEREGFALLPSRLFAKFERTQRTELATYPYQSSIDSYGFFASIRHRKLIRGGRLMLMRAARGDRSNTLTSVAESVRLDAPSNATLIYLRDPEILIAPTRSSLLSLAMLAYGNTLSLSGEYGTIEIPFRRAPSLRFPDGKNANFSISRAKIELAPAFGRERE
jgi:hypothetical protein